ncbi:MAG: polyprenyl synthetase family protein [Rickettsiales bacterium]|jgi:geranylgeranyl pyrophosphate synthase|nr:polyprenyl synthetase family protein [Rickettsiales bacterium]
MSFDQCQAIIDKVSCSVTDYLSKKLNEKKIDGLDHFIEILEYSTIGSGKMLRPFFTCVIGEIARVNNSDLIKLASAIELIHCYSLIHDDLPAMDNDDYRRGKLSTHKQFGEAKAILAGDAIQALAFEILSDIEHPAIAKVINIFAKEIGSVGLVGGQYLDLANENNKDITLEIVNQIILKKTASLLRLSTTLPIYLSSSHNDLIDNMDEFGTNLGMAYQIIDDLLDIEGNIAELGKATGKDKAMGKPNILAVMPFNQAKVLAEQLIHNAKVNISVFEEQAEPLIAMLDYIKDRKN